jgi:hypothetical protein
VTVVHLGELSLSAAVPLLGQFSAALSLANGFALPELAAKLAGLANVLGAITVAPPSLGATITAALATVASLQAAVSGPTVSLQATAILGLVGELTTLLGTLTASASLTVPSGTLSAYVFDGASGALGVELQAAINASLPGAPAHANALILVTTSAPDWAAAQQVFAT